MFEKILKLIEKYDTVIIHRHTNPDGDALGSQIGLKNIIKENKTSITLLHIQEGRVLERSSM